MASMAYFKDTHSGRVLATGQPQYWGTTPGYERVSAAAGKRLHREQARAGLLEILKPGDTVYTVLRHVSASGMSRNIDLYVMREDRPVYLSGYASTLIGWPLAKRQGIVVGGCGMDNGFHLVYTLGALLWPDGTGEPHGVRNGEPDRAGGYALKHSWL
jgi:hypothetical protein